MSSTRRLRLLQIHKTINTPLIQARPAQQTSRVAQLTPLPPRYDDPSRHLPPPARPPHTAARRVPPSLEASLFSESNLKILSRAPPQVHPAMVTPPNTVVQSASMVSPDSYSTRPKSPRRLSHPRRRSRFQQAAQTILSRPQRVGQDGASASKTLLQELKRP